MTAKRVLVLVRDHSSYNDNPDYQRTIAAVVDAIGRRGAVADVAPLALSDQRQVDATVERAADYDRVLCRVTLEGLPIAPVHRLLRALEEAGARCSPRLDHALRLGSKASVYAMRDTPLGLPGVELVSGAAELAAAVDAELGGPSRRAVVKSLFGCGGRGVFLIEPADEGRWRVTCAYDGAAVDRLPAELAAEVLGDAGRALVMPYLGGVAGGEHRYYFAGLRLLDRCLHKRGGGDFSVARGLGGTREMVELAHPEAAGWPALVAAAFGLAQLPALWTIDVIAGPAGRPALSEINVLNVGLRPVPVSFIDAFVTELLRDRDAV
jgi:hypothetical protein